VYKHVKGHQNHTYLTVLAFVAWLNIKADLLAKGQINVTFPVKHSYCLLHESWFLKVNGQWIAKHPKQALCHAINSLLAQY